MMKSMVASRGTRVRELVGVAKGCSVLPKDVLSPMVMFGVRGLGPKWTYSPSVRLAANMAEAVDRQVALGGRDPVSQLFLEVLQCLVARLSPRRPTGHLCRTQAPAAAAPPSLGCVSGLAPTQEPWHTFPGRPACWACAVCWAAGLTRAPQSSQPCGTCLKGQDEVATGGGGGTHLR